MLFRSLESKCDQRKIPFYRANVGDRFVVEMLKEKKCFLGGESSGHLIYLSKSTTGDGLLSAILLLNVLVSQNKSLDEYANSFQRFPQELKSIMVREKKPIENIPSLVKVIDQSNVKLKGKGRTLVRYSGTENKIRVMVESEDEKLMHQVLEDICEVVGQELGV